MLVDTLFFNAIPDEGCIGLIVGDIRHGKSVLGYAMLEAISKKYDRPSYIYGLPVEKETLLPDYIIPINDLTQLTEHSICLFDEAYISFYSRSSATDANKFMDQVAGLIGHLDVIAIYVTQQTRRLEIGLVSSSQFICIKKPSLLQSKFDRPQIRNMMEIAYRSFKNLNPPNDMSKKDYMKRCTYLMSSDFQGMIEYSNNAVEWWSDNVSRAYAGQVFGSDKSEVTIKDKIQSLFIRNPDAITSIVRAYNKYINEVGNSELPVRFSANDIGIPSSVAISFVSAGVLKKCEGNRNGKVQYKFIDILAIEEFLVEKELIEVK